MMTPDALRVLLEPRMDSRIKPIKRIVTVTLIDRTPIPFSHSDQEWIAEALEDKLREKFDVDVENIEVEDAKL